MLDVESDFSMVLRVHCCFLYQGLRLGQAKLTGDEAGEQGVAK